MKILEKRVLRDGYGVEGLSVVLVEFKNGYGVYFYIHAEDRYSECYTTQNYNDALECYWREIRRRDVMGAILRAARKRVALGASIEHIRAYQQHLLTIWGDPEIVELINNLDHLAFEQPA